MPYDFPYMPLMPQQTHLPQAEASMNLSPQEQALYMRHILNLYSPMGGVDVPGGRATLYQAGVNLDGREYNIPTVYNGNILPLDAAVQRAKAQGMDKFPSYESVDEAESRYAKMHDFMEQDTAEKMAYDTINGGG